MRLSGKEGSSPGLEQRASQGGERPGVVTTPKLETSIEEGVQIGYLRI
jgi:hypothetical protein